MISKGDVLELVVSGYDFEGQGISYADDRKVIIPGAMKGEKVSAKVVVKNSRFFKANLEQIVNQSPDRVQPSCVHYELCGGCQLQHIDYGNQLAIKKEHALENLKSIAGMELNFDPQTFTSSPYHYRRKARLSAKYVDKKNKVTVGFREKNSHFVTDANSCDVLVKELTILPQLFSEILSPMSIKNKIPQIEIAQGDEAVGAILRCLEPPNTKEIDILKSFFKEHQIAGSLLLNNKEQVVLHETAPLAYSPYQDIKLNFFPQDFIQVNDKINKDLVMLVVENVKKYQPESVLDLFCGLGNITLPVSRYAGNVAGIELGAGLIKRAMVNQALNHISNINFHTGDLFEEGWPIFKDKWDMLILDPPRSGAQAVIRQLGVIDPEYIIYISCNPGTFARDARKICEENNFKMVDLNVLDMFPQTSHIELLGVFEKN